MESLQLDLCCLELALVLLTMQSFSLLENHHTMNPKTESQSHFTTDILDAVTDKVLLVTKNMQTVRSCQLHRDSG